MNYSFVNCESCGADPKTVGIQVLYCEACDLHFNKKPSAESIQKQINYNRATRNVLISIVALVGATFIFPIDAMTRKSIIQFIFFSCFGYLIYKIYKLQLNPLDRPELISISKNEFMEKLKEYRKNDLWLISFYTSVGIISTGAGFFFSTCIILMVTLPMIGALLFYPLRRLLRINKLLKYH